MVIDCQACGAQQRIEDSKLPASGIIACRGCGAQIRIGGKPRTQDEDATVVGMSRPSRRDPTGLGGSLGPIPLSGTSDRNSGAARPSQGMDFGAIGVSNRRETKQFDVKTSPTNEFPGNIKASDDEPIPLLDADDILDFDEIEDDDETKTIPGMSLSDIQRPLNRPTPNFLEDVPTLIPGPSSQNEGPTRFSRNLNDLDDLPGASAKAEAPKPAAPRPAPRPQSAAPRPPSTGTVPTQTIKPAAPAPIAPAVPAPTPAPVMTEWSATASFASPKTDSIPLPTAELSFDSSFSSPLEIPIPAPSYPSTPLPVTDDSSFAAPSAPADFGNFDNLPQWSPVEAASNTPADDALALELDLSSDLPAPSSMYGSDLPASFPEAPAAASSSYDFASTPIESASSIGESTMQMNRAELGIDFGSELPTPATQSFAAPSFDMDALPNDLPSYLPPIGETTQITGEPRLELEGDLPMAHTSNYSGQHDAGGITLNDDLPMPSIGIATEGSYGDLPEPYAGADADAAPNLMDTADQRHDESTQIVRDEREAAAALDTGHTNALPPLAARHAEANDAEVEAPKKKKKGSGAVVAVAALVVIAGVLGFLTKFPEYSPIELPWVEKPAPVVETPPVPKPDTPPVVADAKPAAKDVDALPEVAPVIPQLTAQNVNDLDLPILREAVKILAADSAGAAGGAGHELVQWARYRLARWGDTDARDALLADPPVLSPQATELTAAAAIGVQMLQNKPMVARKNGERLVGGPGPAAKAKFKDSVPVLLALAAASEKPPFKAIQVNDRILALDPKALDARVGKIEAQLAMPKPEIRREAIAAAVALAKDTKSVAVAVRLGGALANADAASAMADITTPLTSLKQADDLAPGQVVTFARLLAHRAAIAGDFETAKQAIARASEASPDDVALIRTAARIAAAAGGDYATGLAEARGRIRDVDGKATLVDEQVKLALSRGDVAAAKAALGLSADLAPRVALPFAKLSESRVALAEGQVDQARVAATQALKVRPKTFEARLMVIATTKIPPAGELAQLTVLDKQAASPDVDVRLAQAMNERSNAGGAAELYARALWREPIAVDPVGVVIALADATERSGNAEKAGAYLSALRLHVTGDERLGKALLELARHHGNGADAVEYFEAAASKNPSDLTTRLQLAQALIGAGKTIEAQTMLDTLWRTPEGAKSPDVLRELGRAWMDRDSVKARGYANDAIHARPDSASYELLGEIEESQTKYDDAIDAYRKAVKADSTSNSARVRLARVQVQRGQWQDAATQLRDIVQHDPSNLQATELLGDAMRDLGKPREAIVWYKKALDMAPDSATLMMKFARLQLQDLGAVQPAMKSLRHVLQVHPEIAEAHYYLGYALKDLGKTAEAKAELQEYLTMRPDGEFAQEVKNDLQDLAR